jgi:hypothetical protein
MLDQFIASLPKTVLAIIAIVIGFVVIVASDPPRTQCDSQMELFKQQQQDFLYGAVSSAGATQPPLAKAMFAQCQDGNGPGGCFEFFTRLRKMNEDLEIVPKLCAETVAKDDQLQTWIFKSMKLMAQISWGDRGPASVNHRDGWLDASDLAMYCGLKKHATLIYGIEKMDEWRAGVLGSLPEAEKLDRDSVYQRSLLATPCEAYR